MMRRVLPAILAALLSAATPALGGDLAAVLARDPDGGPLSPTPPTPTPPAAPEKR